MIKLSDFIPERKISPKYLTKNKSAMEKEIERVLLDQNDVASSLPTHTQLGDPL